ncbi:TetR/AcrR family transcriptional regulator [Mangrovimicrobium sediminis]|uniref:TetR/AcrR family transcriptional regulator n=1 Tax=Mangrovimicrobium sediminis TaxID=2562682 RepID=A0A4Z0LYC5_9GAMM|nr:TetR/AcrR family transcriptional regulator [Haliea sp. SAOS-164]TGD72281.1 TetR/AcrR family transcriptional regulator [Haliea sp. SAOS-164]
MTSSPPIKRRNATKTRARILAAAQACFARSGYSRSGIREIAALADVSSPMLLRYFGSKAGLFEAALTDAVRIDELLQVDRTQFGAHLAKLFTDAALDLTPPAMIALSTGDDEASEITRRVAEEQLVRPLAAWLGTPDGRVRAVEIFMLSTSFVLYTRQLPLLPASGPSRRKLAAWLSETVQAIVDAR